MSRSSATVQVVRTLDSSFHWQQLRNFFNAGLRQDADAIGFLPWQVYEYHHLGGRILLCFNNGDLVGFLMWRFNAERELRILQVWVRPDARMILHGRALLDAVLLAARSQACWIIRLWCAADLAANVFWQALGFAFVNWRFGPSGRKHFLWTLRVGGTIDGGQTVCVSSGEGLREVGKNPPATRRRRFDQRRR